MLEIISKLDDKDKVKIEIEKDEKGFYHFVFYVDNEPAIKKAEL